MSPQTTEKWDLVVLHSDLTMGKVLEILLKERRKSLGIKEINFKLVQALFHDPDVLENWKIYLSPFYSKAEHALVIFDWTGSGAEKTGKRPENLAEELKEAINKDARKTNWVGVVIIVPELEVWIWADSIHVPHALGFRDKNYKQFKDYLISTFADLWPAASQKPSQPEELLGKIRKMKSLPISSSLFKEIAEKASLAHCSDTSFQKLRDTLQRWFKA